MNKEALDLFECNQCSKDFHIEAYEKDSKSSILEGIIICKECNLWYPIYDGIANFLPPHLTDKSRRDSFREKWQINFEEITTSTNCDSSKDKKLQIDFFNADIHIYDEGMENRPFWKAKDWNCLKEWLPKNKSKSIPILGTFALSVVLILIRTKRSAFGLNKDTNYHHSLIIKNSIPKSEKPIIIKDDPNFFPNAYLGHHKVIFQAESLEKENLFNQFSKRIQICRIK